MSAPELDKCLRYRAAEATIVAEGKLAAIRNALGIPPPQPTPPA